MKYVLFGAGEVGKRLLNVLGKERVSFFCDNNLFGKDVEGVSILSFEELINLEEDYIIVIAVERQDAVRQISEMLNENQLPWISSVEVLRREGVNLIQHKHDTELGFWEKGYKSREDADIKYYKDLMLAVAGEKDERFLEGKVIADFGCGPRGSLSWLDIAKERIGIDVLVTEYMDKFGNGMIQHDMIYVTSSEKYIPIPSFYVDCLMTINSLDHVSDLGAMCLEIKRIVKPGGLLIGSFNLFEPPTECEPQTLTEELLREELFDEFDMQSYRLALQDTEDSYKNVRNGITIKNPDGKNPCVLWVRGIKRG